jgi:hypothetical protein
MFASSDAVSTLDNPATSRFCAGAEPAVFTTVVALLPEVDSTALGGAVDPLHAAQVNTHAIDHAIQRRTTRTPDR